MKQFRLGTLLLGGFVALSACADHTDIVSPEAIDAPAFSAADVDTRHLVVYKNKAGKDLAAEVASLGGTIEATYERFGFAVVSGLSDEAAAALRGVSGIDHVDSDEIFERELPAEASTPAPAEAGIASPAQPATAFFFPRQWNMRAIGAEQAWASGKLGSPDVTVAILDTGIDYLSADLQGLVDLSRSVSLVGGVFPDDDLVAAHFPTRHPVTDLGYHGTHVAATVSSNAFLAAGVGSRTTLIGVKVCTGVGSACSGIAILEGIVHAVDNGADMINMSLGGLRLKSGGGGVPAVFNRIMNYAHQNNVTVVVAAGNSAIDLDHHLIPTSGGTLHFPSLIATYCDTPHVVCVSATGPTAAASVNGPWENVDAPAPYTNFGRSAISVAAPGGSTGGRVWAACSSSSLLVPVCQRGGFIIGISGTSMATPHVAGLAALIVAEIGDKPSQVKNRLQKHADDLGENGTDPFYGKGRINVAASLGVN